MKIVLPWLREFVDVPSEPATVAGRLGLCGFAVEDVAGEVIDFEVTANRPDCLSVYGLAREAATTFDVPLAPAPGAGPIDLPATAPIRVSIGDAGCGRYALAMADITVGPSPDWLADRLTAVGVRPINNVVDVTNYVMLEMGHPMHAFDAARLAGPEIRVRRARDKETLTTLDGQQRTLDETMLVIADRDTAVAVAGVMGGAASEVSQATTRIALESAWFLPATVRATSRTLGLKTEASIRFERGADLDAPVRAIRRALELLRQIGAGQPASAIADVHPRGLDRRTVPLDRRHLARLLGVEVPEADVERILTALGFDIGPATHGWQVTAPSFRTDVTREADLIEEVGRHWGFDRVPATFPALREVPRPTAPGISVGRTIRRVLCGAGLQEAVTFTFIEAQAARACAPEAALVAIRNPLSEKFAVLRPSLLPGLLDSMAYSRRRESSDVRLFEIGSVFSTSGEASRVGWILTGTWGQHWSGKPEPVSFADARGIAELLAVQAAGPLSVEADDTLPWLVPGRRARLVIQNTTVGWIGQVAPELVTARGLDAAEPVFGGELDHGALTHGTDDLPQPIAPLPKFPSIVRDLALVVDQRLPAVKVRGTIRASAPQTLVSICEFDRYQGKGVPDGKVSLAVRLTFRDARRTLTDEEVQQAIEAIVRSLQEEHGAVLRGAGD